MSHPPLQNVTQQTFADALQSLSQVKQANGAGGSWDTSGFLSSLADRWGKIDPGAQRTLMATGGGALVGGLGGLGLGMASKRKKSPLYSALAGGLSGAALGGGLQTILSQANELKMPPAPDDPFKPPAAPGRIGDSLGSAVSNVVQGRGIPQATQLAKGLKDEFTANPGTVATAAGVGGAASLASYGANLRNQLLAEKRTMPTDHPEYAKTKQLADSTATLSGMSKTLAQDLFPTATGLVRNTGSKLHGAVNRMRGRPAPVRSGGISPAEHANIVGSARQQPLATRYKPVRNGLLAAAAALLLPQAQRLGDGVMGDAVPLDPTPPQP